MSLNIISLNVRGMRDPIKRRTIFNYYRVRGNVICLQETHSDSECEQLWRTEWGGNIQFSHGTSTSKGLCILSDKSIPFRIVKTNSDTVGRLLACEFENIDDPTKRLTVCNIYGPNKDSPQFFVDLVNIISEMSPHIVAIGDYNLVMNVQIDRKGSDRNHTRSRQMLSEICDRMYLIDVWRVRNPHVQFYSWMRTRPYYTASRLDFALISQGLSSSCGNCMYIPGIQTDHTAFFININILDQKRGKGYWKFNSSLLTDRDFITAMNIEIDKKLSEASNLSSTEKWTFLEDQLRTFTIKYSKQRTNERDLIISQLSEKILYMEHDISQEFTHEKYDILCRSKADIEELLHEKTKATIFRTKCTWYEMGEKSSKYFLNLEKRRYNAKVCTKLINDQDLEITDPKQIMKEYEKFYTKLYKADEKINFDIQNVTDIKLTNQQRDNIDHPFTKEEIAIALKDLKSNRTPGHDGWSPEFFKMFFAKLGQPMYDMLMQSFQDNALPKQLRTGIINSIPKASKDSRYLKNLRPISLLSTPYKVLERAIANRITPMLDHILSQDQKGFRKQKRISTNIRRIFDLMQYAESNNLQAIILSLDFMKCFDRIEKCAIIGALKYFNFSNYIIKWTDIIYSDFEAKVQNNGSFSDSISIQKGVRQGGPASSVFFLLCAELLAIALKSDESILGIDVQAMKNLLGQFADDMDIYLMCDQTSIKRVLEILDYFHRHTGFLISYEKTQIYRIGSLRNTNAKLITERAITWTNQPISVLGITIDHDNDKALELNYSPIINKIETIFRDWEKRNLSLIGKIQIINSLIASLFVYKMFVLPSIPVKTVTQVEELMSKFIWNGHKPKISLKVLQTSKQLGGMNLVNLEYKDIAIKTSWITMLDTDPLLENTVYTILKLTIKKKFWWCNLQVADVKKVLPELKDRFWIQVAEAWFQSRNTHERKRQYLWYNSEIRVQNCPIFWQSQYQKGLEYIHQLYSEGQLKSFRLLWQEFHLDIMQVNTLVSAIPSTLRKLYSVVHNTGLSIETTLPRTMKQIYVNLTETLNAVETKASLWEKELQIHISAEQYKLWSKNLFCTTNVSKFRSFQYRLTNRAIITNIHLKHWKIRGSDMCSFCGLERETYSHLFVLCPTVIQLWDEIEICITSKFGQEPIKRTVKDILFNEISVKITDVRNFICLVTKQYIYRQRCLTKELNAHELIQYIYNVRNTEKYIASKNNNILKHKKKWKEL